MVQAGSETFLYSQGRSSKDQIQNSHCSKGQLYEQEVINALSLPLVQGGKEVGGGGSQSGYLNSQTSSKSACRLHRSVQLL